MKTLSLYIITVTLITNSTMAQNTKASIPNAANQQETAFEKTTIKNVPENTINVQDINTRALKDFKKVSSNAKEVKWYSEKDCTVAFFKTNDGSSRRYYDAKGNFICNILSCEEQHLPAAVCSMVKSTYYMDYHIISAEEIQTVKKKFYFVFIENKSTWRKLMVYDNEMEVVQECFN